MGVTVCRSFWRPICSPPPTSSSGRRRPSPAPFLAGGGEKEPPFFTGRLLWTTCSRHRRRLGRKTFGSFSDGFAGDDEVVRLHRLVMEVAAAAAAAEPPAGEVSPEEEDLRLAACESPTPERWCSVSRAFSSMVFMVREIQSHATRMREAIQTLQDVQGILDRVHDDMNSSFVWLFRQIFSGTPTLMLCVMIFLANLTVYSMAQSPALSMPQPSIAAEAILEDGRLRFAGAGDSDVDISFSGGAGGGGKAPWRVAGAIDDGKPDGAEDEEAAWRRIMLEAMKMQAESRVEELMDPEVLQKLVAPVAASPASEMEDVAGAGHLRTEMMYQESILRDPENPMLLSNFAQFLYLVRHDHDRAEEYFERAARVSPADAEALSKYASFLWLARNDVAAAEEAYLAAIAADPGGVAYAAGYAHFLWNTGGEDTCYPLDGPGASKWIPAS